MILVKPDEIQELHDTIESWEEKLDISPEEFRNILWLLMYVKENLEDLELLKSYLAMQDYVQTKAVNDINEPLNKE